MGFRERENKIARWCRVINTQKRQEFSVSPKFMSRSRKRSLRSSGMMLRYYETQTEISDLLYSTKCTLSWNKNRLQNKQEISDLLYI